MKLLIPAELILRLQPELRRGGRKEIGGVLVGEHVERSIFRIVDLSVQHTGGTAVHFVRDEKQSKVFLEKFFERVGNDYQRFNYIGEWHSHPSFEPFPSGEDHATMRQIVSDPTVGVNFAILIIATLAPRSMLKLSATAYRASGDPIEIDVQIEGELPKKRGLIQWVTDLFRS
ncbi:MULTISPECIES: Mov34/MPN/PAD-1 family protein [unclassified Afipia]|uniref:Mov34/MPN/PAD-1 family protein n=1 Tax=unclassified Afipia TaxID=2642050 RepID=UPI00042610D1|nr:MULTISPECIES: Mov34/MPN/PAD-1 family protein [unclassified Afipia]